MTDDIGYQALTQAAMRGVMREAIKIAADQAALPGSHHYYITFRTRAPGVKIADQLLKRFPDEMVIVLQHQFWDLEVSDRHFEVVLQFSGVPQHLEIPFAAVTRFHDPSVDFMMVFEPTPAANTTDIGPMVVDEAEGLTAETAAPSEPEEEIRPASDGSVVQLDAFRRK